MFYDYECTTCQHKFELQMKMADNDVPTTLPCPKCDKYTIEQTLGATPTIDSVQLGIRKPDRTFQREVLGRMSKNIARNKIGQGRFSIPGRV